MPNFVIFFTPSGIQELQKEYVDRQSQRPDLVFELTRARDLGDRSENGAYKEARRKLSWHDSRMRFLKKTLDHAQAVHPTQSEYIEIGSIVDVTAGEKTVTFHIVGIHEADPMKGKLSYRSPVGTALMGKRVGDVVEVSVPSGVMKYEVIRIQL